MAWLKATNRTRYAGSMYRDEIDGQLLTEIQYHDLVELGCQDLAEGTRVLLAITELVVEAPGDRPAREWTHWHVRHWLLSSGLTAFVSMFQRCRIAGTQLLQMTEHDIRDIGIHSPADIALILAKIAGLAGETSMPILSRASRQRSRDSLRASRNLE